MLELLSQLIEKKDEVEALEEYTKELIKSEQEVDSIMNEFNEIGNQYTAKDLLSDGEIKNLRDTQAMSTFYQKNL